MRVILLVGFSASFALAACAQHSAEVDFGTGTPTSGGMGGKSGSGGNGAGGSSASSGGKASGSGGTHTGGASNSGGGGTGGIGTGGAASGESCVNQCGGPVPDGSCWCDAQCQASGDCCSDFASACAGYGSGGTGSGGSGSGGAPPGTGSCANACGGPSQNGDCWCDTQCQSSGDCCSDFASACGSSGTGGSGGAPGGGQGCTAALCNSPNPGSDVNGECYCDSLCKQYGDCCANKAQICGN